MERHLKGFGSLFYVVNPYETMFEKVSDLPNPGYLSTVSYNQHKSFVNFQNSQIAISIRDFPISLR